MRGLGDSTQHELKVLVCWPDPRRKSKTCVELGRETLEEEDHAYYNPILQSRGLKIWRRQKIHRPPGRGPTLNTSYTMSRISVLRQSRASRR